MTIKVILGLQSGDEGKSLVTQNLCQKSNNAIIVRFQGGGGASHTIYDENEIDKKVHLLPSGILNPNAVNVITRGVIVDPNQLMSEIKEFNIKVGSLIVSNYCPVVMSWHINDDMQKHHQRPNTDANGVRPALKDFIAKDNLNLATWLEIFHYLEPAKILKDFVGEAELFLKESYKNNMEIVLEGCQGYLLDIWGDEYPHVISSCTTIGSVFYSTRLNHKQIDEVIGVCKIYETRITNNFFEEISFELSEKYREIGKEYSVTTKQPKKIGWLDLDLLKEAIEVNGVDTLILTKTEIPPQIGTLKIKTAEDFWEIKEFWSDINEKPLLDLLNRIKYYTGVKNIAYSFSDKPEDIKHICNK